MDVGYSSLKLPSRCLCYDVFADNIGIRTLRGKDEKMISEMNYDNIDKKFAALLKNVLVGIDPMKLTLGDRKFILIWLSMNSYSKDFPIEFTCEHCNQKIFMDVDLSKFEVTEIADIKLPYELKLSDRVVTLRILTVADEIRVGDFEKGGNNGWILRYALSIVSEDSIDKKIEMLDDMPVSDLAKIRAWHEQMDHGPVMESPYTCNKCGGVGITPVPFRVEMVFPYGAVLKKSFGTAM